MKVRCLGCNKLLSTGSIHRRGACKTCYMDPDIREGLPVKPRGGWPPDSKPWSREDVTTLVRMWLREDKNDKEIGKVLGRTQWAVQRKRQSLNIKCGKGRWRRRVKRTWRNKNVNLSQTPEFSGPSEN